MAKIKEIQVEDYPNYLIFMCPGCKDEHCITRKWSFDNNFENPTISPSILSQTSHKDEQFRCHSYIKNGMIQFLCDCTHELKNQTVELPEIE